MDAQRGREEYFKGSDEHEMQSYTIDEVSGKVIARVVYRCVFFFFFQAEDGIRDLTVTGVQTCALPIWIAASTSIFPLSSCHWLYRKRWASPKIGRVERGGWWWIEQAVRKKSERKIGRASCRERV